MLWNIWKQSLLLLRSTVFFFWEDRQYQDSVRGTNDNDSTDSNHNFLQFNTKKCSYVYCITDHIIYYEFFLQSQWLQGVQEKEITLMMLPQYWGLGYIVWYEMKSTWVKGIVMGGEQKHTHTHSHSPNTDSNPGTPA